VYVYDTRWRRDSARHIFTFLINPSSLCVCVSSQVVVPLVTRALVCVELVCVQFNGLKNFESNIFLYIIWVNFSSLFFTRHQQRQFRLVTYFISGQRIRSFFSTSSICVCIWSVKKTARPSPYLDVQPRNPLYILKGNVWALLRKFFSSQLVFSPPALTICSTGESLPKPFTPLDVSPYFLYHDSLSIPRG